MNVRFLSGNKFKIREADEILSTYGITVISFDKKIEELQTTDPYNMVKDKVLKAHEKVGRPIFVEHTGLYLEYINDLPGGLTQIFWDALQAEKFAELFGNNDNTKAMAKTVIGYCDGKKIHCFEGVVRGNIAKKPTGNRDFQWDCVFIPEGYDKTFAELGDQKNLISMRRKALDQFSKFLKGEFK